jgi:eukaryotic-like serine/threonine-protein kinase
MTLAAGTRVGPYEILAPLGAGGMGEVYRARDTRLSREVALKLLRSGLASDRDRLARFDREGRLLASLNHPNIGAIHGVEESAEGPCLVLELVPGETLAEKLAAGPLPLEEAVAICRQIARALEAAHENGVLHRDLKPSNIKVTPDGAVKVLDFGLAKTVGSDGSGAESRVATVTSGGTIDGHVLGTASYMSPEQARGQALDRRTDIWSFGCVLYETLTGVRAFPGGTLADTLAGVLGREPDWDRLPRGTPRGILRLLVRCLRRERDRRIHDVADARLELEDALDEPALEAFPAGGRPATSRWRKLLPWLLTAAFATAAIVAVLETRVSRPAPLSRTDRLQVVLPPGDRLAVASRPAVAISRDGSLLAYAAERSGVTHLFVRPLAETVATLLPGTDDASGPFFSPDGRWIAFFAERKLKKVPSTGGTPVAICEAINSRGATWADDDTIVFTPNIREGLWRVAASGGSPERLTTPEPRLWNYDHRWSQSLAGGNLLFVDWTPWHGARETGIVLLEPGARRKTTLVAKAEYGRALPIGTLAFVRSGTLFAAALDLRGRKIEGAPRPVPDSVYVTTNTGAAQFDVSSNGTLAYVPGGPPSDRRLVWVDRDGKESPLPAPSRAYLGVDLSPDGSRVAVTIESGTRDVWVYDILRGTLTRLTFAGDNSLPLWSPDGRRLAFASRSSNGPTNLFAVAADGSGAPERLTESSNPQLPTAFSPDGRFLCFTEAMAAAQSDLWVLPLFGDRKPVAVAHTPFDERWGRFSPEGKWLAYVSDESGVDQVYVLPFPGPGVKVQVSADGGREPMWSPDGRELIFTNGDRWLSAEVRTQPTFSMTPPRLLLEARYERPSGPMPNYDISPDGRRLLTVKGSAPENATSQIIVALNWFDELRRLGVARGAPAPVQ